MATGTVTLDRAYFETLLRKAQFHTSGVDFTTPLHVPTVTIPKSDHDSLMSSARQYANLRMNLFRGGIAEETLAVLINDDSPTNGNGVATDNSVLEEQSQGGATLRTSGGQDYTFGRNGNYISRNTKVHQQNTNGYHNEPKSPDEYSYMDGPDMFYEGGSANHDSQPKPQRQRKRQQYEKFAKRTVLLVNLHEDTTHADIVEVVRGGMLLDIYLRTDRSASVSFLEEAHAQAFFRHAKRHDLYVRGKRVELRWHDRQFILPGHVANKVAIGATRNLVIQNRNPKHTEKMIRDDLEHIHNLIVIKVSFGGQNTYISTNSVHNAMFARTCMMSRLTYRGSKIEWDDDECAGPLERPQQYQKENVGPKKKKDAPLTNRFLLLNVDNEDGSADEDEHDTGGVSVPLTMPSLGTGHPL